MLPLGCFLLLVSLSACRRSSTKEPVVFVLDSGVDAAFVGGAVAGDSESPPGHGSVVARVIRDRCRRATVFSIKIENSFGRIERESIFRALADVITYVRSHPDHRVLVNISSGSYDRDKREHDLVKELHRLGVPLVAAAGNDNLDRPFYPAAYPEAVAVAAVSDVTRRKAPYSNYGSYVDLAAAGSQRYYQQYFLALSSREVQGTSFAAPLVSGTLARLLAVRADLSPGQALAVLLRTSRPIFADPFFERGWLGAGVIDPQRAVAVVSPPHVERLIYLWIILPLGMAILFQCGWRCLRMHRSRRRAKELADVPLSEEAILIQRLAYLRIAGRGLAVVLFLAYVGLRLEMGSPVIAVFYSGLLIAAGIWALLAALPELTLRLNPSYRPLFLRLQSIRHQRDNHYYTFRNPYAFLRLRARALQGLIALGKRGLIPDFPGFLKRAGNREVSEQLRDMIREEMDRWDDPFICSGRRRPPAP